MSMARLVLHRLRRVTTNGEYVAEVDGIRCLAIAMVFMFHLHDRVLRHFPGDADTIRNGFAHSLLLHGKEGVSIFFALSGYILYKLLSQPLLEGRSLSLSTYWLRRATRLEPPYVIITTIIALFLVTTGYQTGGHFVGSSDGSLALSYLCTITYCHMLVFGRPPSLNPPGWSLEVEIQFYIIAPLLAIYLIRMARPAIRCGVVIVAIVVWCLAAQPIIGQHPMLGFTIIKGLPFFLVGIVVCEAIREADLCGDKFEWPSWFLDICALLSLGCLVGVYQSPLSWVPLILIQCVLVLFILLGALRGRVVRSIAANSTIAVIGGMCYTLYLTHVPIVELVTRLTRGWLNGIPYWPLLAIELLITLPFALIGGAVAFVLIEKPCMRKTWPADLWGWMTHKSSRSNVVSAAQHQRIVVADLVESTGCDKMATVLNDQPRLGSS